MIDVLKNQQESIKVYFVPFDYLNKEVIKSTPANYRMILYRRGMVKIAEKILEKEKAAFFVTGDSIGQVASQTLDNIRSIYQATKYPIVSPLIGLNKEEIIDYAKEIGTYDISIEPYTECCSFMIAKHPITHSKLDDVLKFEGIIPWKEVIENSIEAATTKVF